MKLKQLLLIVSISAGSAIASVWGYNKFTHKMLPLYKHKAAYL